ncbi:Mitochondrial inner membrane protease subunit 2 [Pseudozyma hubeiensis]|nr:Mitochondrial inner membrane protease subunit 2 [Pseudozyma hubeiensis]
MLKAFAAARIPPCARSRVAQCSVNVSHRLSSTSSSASPNATSSSTDSSNASVSSSSSSDASSSSSKVFSGASPSRYPGFDADPARPPPRAHSRTPRSRLNRTLFLLGWIPVSLFITSHLYSLGNVTGSSMSPTFNGPPSLTSTTSDVVLLNRTIKVSLDKLKAGDIVTLISPLDPRLLLTKRIIALAGDTVRVYAPGMNGGAGKWTRIKIPPGHVWVEGDAAVDIVPGSLERTVNGKSVPRVVRNKSRDSREFGPVPMGLITSRIEAIVWPPERFGAPAARPSAAPTGRGQYPPSSTMEDRSTQVNPSLARILDEMTSMAPETRSKAHPQDSVISPYVDWGDPNGKLSDEEGGGKGEGSEDEKRRKTAWNTLSRGGRLGDDAD